MQKTNTSLITGLLTFACYYLGSNCSTMCLKLHIGRIQDIILGKPILTIKKYHLLCMCGTWVAFCDLIVIGFIVFILVFVWGTIIVIVNSVPKIVLPSPRYNCVVHSINVMHNINNNYGPPIEPCGTPHCTF